MPNVGLCCGSCRMTQQAAMKAMAAEGGRRSPYRLLTAIFDAARRDEMEAACDQRERRTAGLCQAYDVMAGAEV